MENVPMTKWTLADSNWMTIDIIYGEVTKKMKCQVINK